MTRLTCIPSLHSEPTVSITSPRRCRHYTIDDNTGCSCSPRVSTTRYNPIRFWTDTVRKQIGCGCVIHGSCIRTHVSMHPIYRSFTCQNSSLRCSRIPCDAADRERRGHRCCRPGYQSRWRPSSKRNRPPGTVSCDTPDSDRTSSQRAVTAVSAHVRKAVIHRIPGLC